MTGDETPSRRWRGTGPDLGMVCTCGQQRRAASDAAMADTLARHPRLRRDYLVTDLLYLLDQLEPPVNQVTVSVDQWFGISYRIGYRDPEVRGVVQCDEVEHGLNAILRHHGPPSDGDGPGR